MDLKILLSFLTNQKIYTKVKNEEPTYYANTSKVRSSQFASGSIIEGEVVQSVLSRNIYVHKDSVVKDSILFPRLWLVKGFKLNMYLGQRVLKLRTVCHSRKQSIQLSVKKGETVTEDIYSWKFLFVAAEGPFQKQVVLGDVIGALLITCKSGAEVAVFLPYYDMVEAKFGDQIRMFSTLKLV